MALVKDGPLEFVACVVGAEVKGLKTVRVSPAGEVASQNGTYILDQAGAEEIIREFEKHGAELPIDLNHATIDKDALPHDGIPRAYGWIKKLWFEAGRGLFALVGWTTAGAELILTESFKYLSPVLLVEKKSRRAVRLHSAALTNHPALPKQEALALSAHSEEVDDEPKESEESMDDEMKFALAKLAEALGAGPEVSPREVIEQAIEKVKAMPEEAALAGAVRLQLGIDPKATPYETLAAIACNVSEAQKANEARKLIETEQREGKVTELMAHAVKNGKINPHDAKSMELWAGRARANFEETKALLASVGPIVPVGRIMPYGAPPPVQTSRSSVIQMALSEYRWDANLAKLTSPKAYANLKLSEAGLESLTTDEARTFAVGA